MSEMRRPRWRLRASPSPALWLLFVLSCVRMSAVCSDTSRHEEDSADVLIIDSKTNLKKLFECSSRHSIGNYNEYYVTCGLKLASRDKAPTRIEVHEANILAEHVYSDVSNAHVELELVLNASASAGTSIALFKSSIRTSAVRLEASVVHIDSESIVNVTALGLKFGPGYNSWFNMGSSYGGMGGAALAGVFVAKCDDVPRLNYFRAIGSIDGAVSGFQGYGSGGGNDGSRGGGRIRIRAMQQVVINGSLVASGGPADIDGSDSAGSGGTILVEAGRIQGTGTVQANGGEPTAYDRDARAGGGGGGGGGRIVLQYAKLDELNATQLQAYGGGVLSKEAGHNEANPMGIQWCQLGGDGSILKIQVEQKQLEMEEPKIDGQVATLVLKGRRADHGAPGKPATIYGCTPLFYQTARGDPFVPSYVAQLFVTGGASVCASYLVLQPQVITTNSSIVIESGSSISSLDRNHTVMLGATHVSIQSYVGPTSQSIRDAFTFVLTGTEITLANAQLLVEQLILSATSSILMDKYSVVKFHSRVSLTASGNDVSVLGILEPTGEEEDDDFTGGSSDPYVDVTASKGSVVFTPQAAQIGALSVKLHAEQDMTLDLPFEAPFLTLSADAANLVVIRLSGGAMRECKAAERQASATTCDEFDLLADEHLPYLLKLKATATLALGNVTSGSILACCDGLISVEGRVTADGLGCPANNGPGVSSIVDGASGGAGHGGKGGNVEPGNAGSGKPYDFPQTSSWPEAPSWPIWPGSGAAAGDGSGAIAGGSGGGLVYMGASKLVLTKPTSMLSARGGAGSKNGGGGAGGAISLFVGELGGSGHIDVSGGESLASTSLIEQAKSGGSTVWQPLQEDGTKGAGGGGGGGIIRTLFRGDRPGTAGNGDQFLQDGGVLTMAGGKSHGGEDGGAGLAAAVNCTAGRGGELCLECVPGSFSPNKEPRCLPCEPGSFSAVKGLGACDKCAAGSFNADFGRKACSQCEKGTFAKTTGAKACAPCAPGSFANTTGTAACHPCPIGSISVSAGATTCTLCGIGQTTLQPGALHCSDCAFKPDHASFNVRGKCTYACEKGRNGLDCLTPFERFIKPIGGPLGFALLVLGFAMLVFGSWGFITYRSNSDQHFKQRFQKYKAQTQRDAQSFANLTKNLTPRLTDHDLVGHVTRMYFSGDNHLFSSWVLDPFGMSAELKELLLDDDAFASFATSCNQLVAWPEHGGWECWVHRLLLALVPPLSTSFLRTRQLARVERLAKHITHYTGGFVRELGFRRHGAQLKVGFSPDFSLAYFDVIAPTTSFSSVTSPSPSRSRLPDKPPIASLPTTPMTTMLIAVAGSGSFFRPYHIDTNDVLVRAVPARLELLQHQFWIDFIAEMNERLRLLQQPSASSTRQQRVGDDLREIVEFVEAFNSHGSDGILVRFGTIVSTSHFVKLRRENIETRLEAYATDPFKFALLVTKRTVATPRQDAPSAIEATAPTAEECGDELHPPVADTTNDPRPVEFRYSQIRMEALFERSGVAEEDESSQPLFPEKARRRSGTQVAISTVSDLLLCSPRSPTFHTLAMIFRPLSPIFRLRNLRPRLSSSPYMLPFLMVVLLVADFLAMFWVLMEFYCIQVDDPTAHDSGCSRVAFVSVLSVLPGAMTCAPLLGLVFLTRKSVFYGKLFAVWTLGSIVNLLVALLCGILYFNYIRETTMLMVVAGVVLKVLEKEIALLCIAQYTVERPLRGWRGLHTTKDWYDAAYTPLIHYER